MISTVERCDVEVLLADGITWVRRGSRAIPVSTVTRPAPHLWEDMPPCYRRCRSCRRVEVLEAVPPA